MYQKSSHPWPVLAILALALTGPLLAQDAGRRERPEAERDRCLRCRTAKTLIAGLRCRFCEDGESRCKPCLERAARLTSQVVCEECRAGNTVCKRCRAVNDEACAICLARDQLALRLRCTERAPGRGSKRPAEAKGCEHCRRWRASVYDRPCRRCSEASRLVQRFARDGVKGSVERARTELAGFAFLRAAARNTDARSRKTVAGELRLLRGKAEVGRGLFILRLEPGGEAARAFAIELSPGADGARAWDSYELTEVKVFDFWLGRGGAKNREGPGRSSSSGGGR